MKKAFFHQTNGSISVLKIDGKKVTKTQEIEVGGSARGCDASPRTASTSGRKLSDPGFLDPEGQGGKVTDTGKRFKVPGHPASARMSRN